MCSKLNEEVVKSLPAPAKGNKVFWFTGAVLGGYTAPRGFGVRVTAKGARSFILNYSLRGKEYRYTIGQYDEWKPLAAVRFARELRQRIDKGENPLDDKKPVEVPKVKTVSSVLDDFVARYVLNKERPLRSARNYTSAFDRHVRPRIGARDIYELRRPQVAKMLDEVEDSAGPVAADRTRAYLHKALAWYAERDEAFNLSMAIGKAKARANATERARARVLTDAELQTIWPRLDAAGTFGALVKALLLTAQRRDEVANMTRDEIGADGIWTIPAERYKTKRPNHVPLSAAARAIIDTQWAIVMPKAKKNPASGETKKEPPQFIFPSSAGTAFSAFSKGKRELDAAVLKAMQDAAEGADVAPIPNWTLHDLRRTAKTLMMRAGVRPDISERVLGHVIAGVEGTYDRHSYATEKRDALEKLAAMVLSIVAPAEREKAA
jgi:integrase